jgi:hypothetical protein
MEEEMKPKKLETEEQAKNVLGNLKKEEVLIVELGVGVETFQPIITFFVKDKLLGNLCYETLLEYFGKYFTINEVSNLKLWNFTPNEKFKYKVGQTVWWHDKELINFVCGTVIHCFKTPLKYDDQEEYYIIKLFSGMTIKTWGELSDDEDKPINLSRKIEEIKNSEGKQKVKTPVLKNMDEILENIK